MKQPQYGGCESLPLKKYVKLLCLSIKEYSIMDLNKICNLFSDFLCFLQRHLFLLKLFSLADD